MRSPLVVHKLCSFACFIFLKNSFRSADISGQYRALVAMTAADLSAVWCSCGATRSSCPTQFDGQLGVPVATFDPSLDSTALCDNVDCSSSAAIGYRNQSLPNCPLAKYQTF